MKEKYTKPEIVEYGKLLDITFSAGAGSFCDNTGSGYYNYSGWV